MSQTFKTSRRGILTSCGCALFIFLYSLFDTFSHPKYFYPFWKFYHGNSSIGELLALLDKEGGVFSGVLYNILFNFALITALIVGVIIFRKPLGRLEKGFQTLDRRLFLSLVFAFSLINLIGHFKYRFMTFPQGGDDAAYLYQAKLLSQGRLWAPSHPLKEFFQTDYIINHNGKTYAEYTLGTPMFLALGFLVGAPWLVNPLLGSLSLIFLYLIAARFFDESIARYGTILISASIYFLIICATYTSHPTTLFCLSVFLFTFIKTIDEEVWFYPLISGLFFGIAINSRQLTAVSFAIPFWIWGFYRLVREEKKILPLAGLFIAGSALPILGLMIVNNLQNGGPLVFGHTIYNGPKKTYGFTDEYNFLYAVGTYFFRWRYIAQQWVSFLFFPAVIFILLLFSCFGKELNRRLIWWALFSVSLAYLPVISNLWHIRYYFVPVLLLIFLVPLGLRHLGLWLKHRFHELEPDSIIFVFVIACFFYFLKSISLAPDHMVTQYMRPYRVVQEAAISNAVVFVKGTLYFTPNWYSRNSPDYNDDILYAIDLGEENKKLMGYYPNRSYYRYDLGTLIPIGEGEEKTEDKTLIAPAEKAPYIIWERE